MMTTAALPRTYTLPTCPGTGQTTPVNTIRNDRSLCPGCCRRIGTTTGRFVAHLRTPDSAPPEGGGKAAPRRRT